MTMMRVDARRWWQVAAVLIGGCGGGSDDAPADAGSGGQSTEAASSDGDDAGPGPGGLDSTGVGESTEGGSESTGPGDTAGAPGCEGVSLLDNPVDPAQPGPWPVGARTVEVAGLTAEVWYPAELGSESGQDTVVYDIRESLPEGEAELISDEDNPWQPCECWRDLPIDAEHGPYPAVFFIHGTAGFRTQSLPQMTHWASRGFVVIAIDHPGLWLADLLGSVCGGPNVPQDLGGDVRALMSAARAETPGLEGIAEHVDPARLAVAGHSAGANATAQFGSDAQVLIPMAGGGVDPGTAVVSTLVMGALDDSVVPYTQQVGGYASSPAPKRLVGIENQGHLAFSGLCSLQNAAGEDLLEIASAAGVCGANLAGVLFQCDDTFLPDPDTWEIVNFATSAVLEEALHCADTNAVLLEIQTRYPAVAEFQHEP